jgi:YegS/Rv2252/BmrU family lipid kinase
LIGKQKEKETTSPLGGGVPSLEAIPRKIKIIVNPNAGGGKGRKLFPLLRQKLLDRKISFYLQFSENAEHVTHLARQAQGEGYDVIVSCGGDGTAHRALQTMVGSRFILGFIPLGSGNDFPRNLGIPEDLDFACDLLMTGKVRKIDVIQVNSGEYMAGVGGVGFDSEVNAIANRLTRFLGGKAAYVLPVLYKTFVYQPKEISLRLDNETAEGPVLMVAFGNIKSYGKGMQITPLAEPDDGLLDVCWIDPVKKFRLVRFFPTVFRGEHIEMPEVHYYRSTSARVESSIPMDFYGDGELIGKTPFTLRLLPQALRVLVP